MAPEELTVADLAGANGAGVTWAADVNGQLTRRLRRPRRATRGRGPVAGKLPSMRPRTGKLVIRKVDRLSCVQFGAARYSVPTRHIGKQVEVRVADGTVDVILRAQWWPATARPR